MIIIPLIHLNISQCLENPGYYIHTNRIFMTPVSQDAKLRELYSLCGVSVCVRDIVHVHVHIHTHTHTHTFHLSV